MYEIELKAWLDDRQSATKILSETARYDGIHDKIDTYWSLQPQGSNGRRVTIRIRKETVTMGDNGTPSTVFIVTYKRHKKNTSPSGETYEVNDEKEFELPTEDAAEAFRTFLEDAGFRVSLNKHKIAEGWYKDDYHIEICTVDKLGDFIEIETLAQNEEPATVQARQKGILDILDQCKVPRNRIENKYYRELLEENKTITTRRIKTHGTGENIQECPLLQTFRAILISTGFRFLHTIQWRKTMRLTGKEDILLKLYGTAEEAKKQAERYEKLLAEYAKRYGTSADSSSIRLFSSPGRTEICGNHTDHNLGKVLAASIHLDCIGAVEPADGTITVHDITYNEDFSIDITDTSRKAGETGSAALIRGMLQALKDKGLKTGGFKACFQSDVIAAAGVSSSASFEMIIGTIINHLYNDGKLPVSVLASAGQYAENKYWDKGSGLLDQTACATGGMVTIDFADPVNPAVNKLNFDFAAQGYTMMIVNTGKSHADLSAEYSSIPNEMKSVAAVLGQKTLRGLSFEDVYTNLPLIREKCGDRAALRAFHFFEENDRVEAQAKALENNDFATFLKIITESGNSSWKWLQNICVPNHKEEQPVAVCLALTEHFIKTLVPGKAACRIHGGGFAGVIQAFIPSSLEAEYREYMEKALGWSGTSGTKSPVYAMKIRPLGSVEVK